MRAPAPKLPPRRRSRKPVVIALLAAIVTLGVGWEIWQWWTTRPGSLQVSTMPPKVKVYINQELMGETQPSPDGRGSLVIEQIPHGMVDVMLEAQGHTGLKETIRIRPAQTFAWQPNLPKEALPDGRIILSVEPANSLVTLGDEEHQLANGKAVLSLGDGLKRDLFIRANNYRPYQQKIGPLKPGSSTPIDVTLKMERWNLEVIPDPPTARVKISSPGYASIAGKGRQTLRGLKPSAKVMVNVSQSRCKRRKKRISSQGKGEQTVNIKLRCR